jgi:hypothetical protein
MSHVIIIKHKCKNTMTILALYPYVFYTFTLKLVEITFHIAPTCEVSIIVPCKSSQIYLNIILTFDVGCFGLIVQNT